MQNTTGLFSESRYLRCMEENHIYCNIFLTNGFQMHSVAILEHDDTAMMVDVNGIQQMVYRRAISTIVPLHPVRLENDYRQMDGDGE